MSSVAYSSLPAAAVVESIYRKYWPAETSDHIIEAEVRRLSVPIQILQKSVPAGGLIVDVGCGWGALSCALSALGFRSIMLDDCRDQGFFAEDKRHYMPADYGVEFIQRDAAEEGVDFPAGSVDAFVSLHSIEHWHRGPKQAFDTMMAALKPGGVFLLAGPNANDLAKRITVPLGMAEWAPFEEWYARPVYRSHVHELTVRDLKRIAQDLNLQDPAIFGTCSSALMSSSAVVRGVMRPMDYVLRLFPSLCMEIYLCGRKRG
jgi:2-polyprenyl-3-methyl-5-hydroxy-6-metoxy-1,4-benzoquinol methylase